MLAPPRDAVQRVATGRLDRAMSPHSLKPDQAAKLCVPLANKYGVPAPNRQLVDIVKARISNHTLPLAARSNPAILYGGVDGQKFESATPTIKARYSRKYFGRGKGVVAYTLLANHVPLETELIGANEHESHYVFDICYHNTSDIVPMAITGDMHSVNKANFAVTYWFGAKFAPRFTSLQAQPQPLYCASDIAQYEPYLLSPAGQIDRGLITPEKDNVDRIIATLG